VKVTDKDKAHRIWKSTTLALLKQISSLRCSDIFSMPVKDKNAPNYSKVIHCPMDLYTIKRKIETGVIRTNLSFRLCLSKMIQNAIMYNQFRDNVYMKALDLMREIMPLIEKEHPTNKRLFVDQEAQHSRRLALRNQNANLIMKRTKRAAAKESQIKTKRSCER